MKQTGWRYTIYMTDEGWIAETHCDCGSTITGDTDATSTGGAIESARYQFEGHLERASKRPESKCGTRNHYPETRLEDEQRRSAAAREAALESLDNHGGGDAPPPPTYGPSVFREAIKVHEHAKQLASWPYMVLR